MNKTLAATLICARVAQAMAGGPALVEEDAEVVVQRLVSSVNSVIPLLRLIVLAAAASGRSSTEGDGDGTDSGQSGG